VGFLCACFGSASKLSHEIQTKIIILPLQAVSRIVFILGQHFFVEGDRRRVCDSAISVGVANSFRRSLGSSDTFFEIKDLNQMSLESSHPPEFPPGAQSPRQCPQVGNPFHVGLPGREKHGPSPAVC
jgi:hypothetical protein